MNIKEQLQKDATHAKRLWDHCERLGEGIHGVLHLLYSESDIRDLKKSYRGYHADGYCFDISQEPYEEQEGEQNDSAIDGFEYGYNDEAFEGFKTTPADNMLRIIKKTK